MRKPDFLHMRNRRRSAFVVIIAKLRFTSVNGIPRLTDESPEMTMLLRGLTSIFTKCSHLHSLRK